MICILKSAFKILDGLIIDKTTKKQWEWLKASDHFRNKKISVKISSNIGFLIKIYEKYWVSKNNFKSPRQFFSHELWAIFLLRNLFNIYETPLNRRTKKLVWIPFTKNCKTNDSLNGRPTTFRYWIIFSKYFRENTISAT